MKVHKQTKKRVLVFGDFDVLHPGHLHFLREARRHGGELVVVVTRAKVIDELKGRIPLFGDRHRLMTVKALRIVDDAILGDATPGFFRALERTRPDVICLGYDQTALAEAIDAYMQTINKMIPLKRVSQYQPEKQKSTRLKRLIAVASCVNCRI